MPYQLGGTLPQGGPDCHLRRSRHNADIEPTMCGIAGTYAYRNEAPPVDREALLRVRERMHSRGPDGAGIWISDDRRIGLAHRRLAIIDLSDAGAQPMHEPETGNQIVFNGEIYNYRALRAQLETAGHRFRSHSDTEVLLKLYAERGKEMLPMLRGMFAFAIWDANKRGVFLARDPFGIKPLYIADDGKTLRFASQVKALLAGGGIDTRPEPAGHVGFHIWGHIPEPYTLYQGIRALPAGSSLWLDRDGRKTESAYFDLSAELAAPQDPIASMRPEEAREILHAALRDSVRHHLISDVPVGVFLSAGLDSSTLVALATEQLDLTPARPSSRGGIADAAIQSTGRNKLRTLTLGFKEFVGTENDEVPLAETVARHYGTAHHTQWVSQDDFAAEYDRLLDAMDQPSIDGVNSYFVCKAAQQAGLKVALSGLGGDELFAGYSHFQSIPNMVRRLAPLATIPGLGRGFRLVSAPILKHFTSPKAAGLIEYGGDHAGAYLLRRGLFMPWELPNVLDGEIVKQGWQDLQTLTALRHTIRNAQTDRQKISLLETSWYMRNQLLRDADWASMAHSLEIRVPLVDIALARTVNQLVMAGQAPYKRDMADCLSQPLPRQILERRKTGFSIPVSQWVGSPEIISRVENADSRLYARQIHAQQCS